MRENMKKYRRRWKERERKRVIMKTKAEDRNKEEGERKYE